MKQRKVVLITGAGFSAKADVPIQSAVLRKVIEFTPHVGDLGRSQYTQSRKRLQRFLNSVFLGGGESSIVSPEDLERLDQLTLEDVYTILDKAISRKDWLPYHRWADLVDVRQDLDFCVCHYLTACQDQYQGNDYVNAVRLLYDKFGVDWATITLNWDTLWDKPLIQQTAKLKKVPDYGCMPLWLTGGDYHLTKYPHDRLGVKLLKLHGSFNWITCPRCRALFIGESDLGKLGYVDSLVCPLCDSSGVGPSGPALEPLFVTPTILKAFENPSLNMVWDTALHTLAGATHVIFAGYSFPMADHDVRYLLRKAIPSQAKVTVILHESDIPTAGLRPNVQNLLPQARYKAFFGLDDSAFHYEGWEEYFINLTNNGA